LAGIVRGQKEITVTCWIGISCDEIQRMKASREKWCQHRWPLVEMRMSREDCKRWMRSNGYPEPPRSACSYCPFHSDKEWRRLKNDEPEAFAEAVRVEKEIQAVHRNNPKMPGHINGIPYLHRSQMPLDEVDFSTDEQRGQSIMAFGNMAEECEGMCGL